MASKPLLVFFLLFTTYSLARKQQNQCQIQNMTALDPYDSIHAEAGVTEIWDAKNQQFQCAGVDFIRYRIRHGGVLLTSYVNTPILFFVEKGHGVYGVILIGCTEPTYEFDHQDVHQRVESLSQGDVVAIPTASAHWLHNDGGDTDLMVVFLFDTQSNDNQLLDENHRRFFLAGNPKAQNQHQAREGQGQGQDENSGNIFSGFDAEILAEAFNVNTDIAVNLQGQNDQRGAIVSAQITLREQQHLHRRHGGINGFEETICSLKLKENIDDPSNADFVNPQAGRIANLNSFKFPVLKQLQLSVERGELQGNAIQSPHWTINAHSIVYVTDGTMRVQIVNNVGNLVFDGKLREGQVVVIPQNFVVIKKAGEQGCRWVSFKTNDNAMIGNLAGRASVIGSLPVDVVANSYQLSRDDARRLMFSQQQAVLFKPKG